MFLRPCASRAGRCAWSASAPRRGCRGRVDHRRVPEQQAALALRRAALRDRRDRCAEQLLRELLRVGDRRRGKHEHRVAAVEAADAAQPPQHVRDVRAEHAAVGVQLVDHHVARFSKNCAHFVWCGRIPWWSMSGSTHDVAARAHRLAGVARRVTVEGEGAHAEVACAVELDELGDLVLRQRLGRKEVEALAWPPSTACSTAGCSRASCPSGGRHDDDVPARGHRLPGRGLVRVEALQPARRERPPQPRIELARQRRVPPSREGITSSPVMARRYFSCRRPRAARRRRWARAPAGVRRVGSSATFSGCFYTVGSIEHAENPGTARRSLE